MFKKLIASLLALSISMPVQSFASTDVVLNNAGITPDSPLYTIDLAFENVRLTFTLDEAKKAELLYQIAEERVAEGQQMIENQNAELTQKALEGYKNAMEKASDVTEEAIEEEKDITAVTNQLTEKTAQLALIVDEIIQQLPEEVKQELAEKLRAVADEIEITNEAAEIIQDNKEGEDADQTEEQPADQTNNEEDNKDSLPQCITHKVLEENIKDNSFLERAAEEGLSLKKIMVIKVLSQKTGKSLDECLDIYLQGGKGIGESTMSFGFKPKDIFKDIKAAFKEVKADIKNYTVTEQNIEKIQDANTDEIDEILKNSDEIPSIDQLSTDTNIQTTNNQSDSDDDDKQSGLINGNKNVKQNNGNAYGKYKTNKNAQKSNKGKGKK